MLSEFWSDLRYRLRAIRRRDVLERDLDDELRFHLEREAEKYAAQGLTRDGAFRRARVAFGGLDQVKEKCRDMGRVNLIEDAWKDFRHSARGLRRSPGFAAATVLTLALGIGATTAIFSLLDQLVLRPLPYEEAERLVYIDTEVPGERAEAAWGVSEAGYFYLREHNRTFEAVGAYGGAEAGLEFTVTTAAGGARVSGAYVSASLLEVLRARPAIGRLIHEEDDGWMRSPTGRPTVALLGNGFWLREYGGDPDVVGTTLQLEGGLPLEVIGIIQPGFHLPHSQVDVWLPLGLDASRAPEPFHGYRVIGRLAQGATLEEAAADLAALTAQFPEAIPEAYSARSMEESGFRTRVTRLQARVLGGLDAMLWILLGSVGLVLLIACANVANLVLVRADARRRDRAIRMALGTSRLGLIRLAMTESLLLSLAAAVLGVWLAHGALRFLLIVAPTSLSRLNEASLSGATLAATLAFALAAAIVFSCLPFLVGFPDSSALRDGGRGITASGNRQRVRGAMIVAQMALALVLLASAGLMLQSFERLHAVDPGLDATNVLTIEVYPPAAHERYTVPGTGSIQHFYRDLIDRVASLPGVQDVSVGGVPLSYDPLCLAAYVEDRPLGPGQQAPCIDQSTVAPGFFRTLGIPLQGREPTWAETDREWTETRLDVEPWADGEVVVTRALAERFWPDEDPIGKGIRLRSPGPPYARVVGVTGQLHGDGLDRPPVEHIFGQLWYRSNTLVVRADVERPQDLAAVIRSTIGEVDPVVAVGRIQTMEDVIATSPSMARTSFTLLLLGIGAMMGVLLSAVGLFGVLAYIVGRRQAEIGIRMALGAPARQVATMIVRHSLKLAVGGVVLGLLGALAATQLLRSHLFGVSPADPATLAVVALVLLVVALVACWVPARRAAQVDPTVALRAE